MIENDANPLTEDFLLGAATVLIIREAWVSSRNQSNVRARVIVWGNSGGFAIIQQLVFYLNAEVWCNGHGQFREDVVGKTHLFVYPH